MTTRKQEHEIIIDAPIEAVWKAISDGEELTRWFVETAHVEPGVGGTVEISWGGPDKAQSRIEAWEPNQKLRLAKLPSSADAGEEKKEAPPIVHEYTIERAGGRTVLRLVQSGIPSSAEWDSYYDGTNTGWKSFLRTMRHYLEHHQGKPRTTITIVGKLPGSLDEAWTRLTGSGGLGFEPVAGQAFSSRTGWGETVQGDVVFVKAPAMLELTVHELDDAFLAHAMAAAGPNPYVYSVLSLYGKSAADVEAIRAQWQPWLREVLGLDPAPVS